MVEEGAIAASVAEPRERARQHEPVAMAPSDDASVARLRDNQRDRPRCLVVNQRKCGCRAEQLLQPDVWIVDEHAQLEARQGIHAFAALEVFDAELAERLETEACLLDAHPPPLLHRR